MNWRDTLSKHYSGAIPWSELVERCNRYLGGLGMTPANTLFSNVVCRDEINKTDVDAFGDFWGENFNLAGLGGYPAAGVTGFTAYHHHVPDDGNLFVLYGPHIGISLDGELGKIERDGMTHTSSACGALVGLLGKAETDPKYTPSFSHLDPEQHLVEQGLLPHLQESLNAPNPLKALTNHMYHLINSTLTQVVDKAGFNGQTVMLGGIMINTPRDETDAFLPLHADILNFQGTPGNTHDWLTTLKS